MHFLQLTRVSFIFNVHPIPKHLLRHVVFRSKILANVTLENIGVVLITIALLDPSLQRFDVIANFTGQF